MRVTAVTVNNIDRRVSVKTFPAVVGIEGKDAFQVWQELPGNEDKTIEDYLESIKGDTGPKGDRPNHQWSGTQLSIQNPDGSMGGAVDLRGAQGYQGWTPVTVEESDGARMIKKLADYTGGEGAKPTAYIGQWQKADGSFTSNKAEAKDYVLTGKIAPWNAQVYAGNFQVTHSGRVWTSNANTLATDVPGVSTKWVEDLSGYTWKNVSNGLKALFFSMGSSSIDWNNTTKKLKSSSTIYIFSGTSNGGASYVRFLPGELDLSAAITANPGVDYFYCYIKTGIKFLDGSVASGAIEFNFSSILVKAYSEASIIDIRSDDAIVLFMYNKVAGTIRSPFYGENLWALGGLADAAPMIKTHEKLHFTHRGDFDWNSVTKVLTWSAHLYIFNRVKVGALPANYIRIDIGSFDFKTYADTKPDEFFVAYIKLSSGSALNFINGTGAGALTISLANILYKGWSEDGINEVWEHNCIVLFEYNKTTGRVSSPLLTEDITTNYLISAKSAALTMPWVNNYPNIYAKVPNFLKKYSNVEVSNVESKIRILLLGDSLLARDVHTSVLDVVADSNPPTLISKNVGDYIWRKLKGNKPIYSRYDKAGRFTEVGAWTAAQDLGNWDDATDISSLTRRSTDTTASFSFTVAGIYNNFNLIDRMDSAGQTDVIVSILGGSGLVQARLEGDTVWVEANGFSFSQRSPAANTALGIGNTKQQRRIEFKKVNAALNTAQTITIGKGTANASALMYWGVEEISGNRPYNQLINVARGGHKLEDLKVYIQSDIYDRKPNLLILEIPLLNMVAFDSSLTYNINQVHDFVWGDRAGNLNPLSIKNKSNNWADFEVILVIPHHARSHFNSSNVFVNQASGYTAEDIYQAVKGFICSRGDVGFIDMSSAMLADINSDPLFNGDYYTALGSSGLTGNGYMNDGTHQNNKGTITWAKHICPIFSMNTF